MNYCEAEDLYLCFGETNVRKWADLENAGDDAHVQARIAWAIEQATAYFDDRLRNGPYLFPLGSGTEVPAALVRACALYAGAMLYEARGLSDADSDAEHSLRWAEKKADNWIKAVIARIIRLDLELLVTDHPFVVEDEPDTATDNFFVA